MTLPTYLELSNPAPQRLLSPCLSHLDFAIIYEFDRQAREFFFVILSLDSSDHHLPTFFLLQGDRGAPGAPGPQGSEGGPVSRQL